MNNQRGNISLSIMLGAVGIAFAFTQVKSVNNSVREVGRQRLSSDSDSLAISSLGLYKGMLSSNGINAFGIYPEPYLKADSKLNKFSDSLGKTTQFTSGTQTVSIAQLQRRELVESDLIQIMKGHAQAVDFCLGKKCSMTSIKLLGFNRDVSGPVPEKIQSADVEVSTEVTEPGTGAVIKKKVVAQVPIEAPRISEATLRLSGIDDAGVATLLTTANLTEVSKIVTVDVPKLSAQLLVGGVAVSGEIAILEHNKTYSSDDQDQWGRDRRGFPNHGAVSISNKSSSLVKTPVFTVQDGRTYTLVARVQGVDDTTPNPELRIRMIVKLPPPPDPSICENKCADKSQWYDGEFTQLSGKYASMIPGMWSCMYNASGDWDDALGNPVYSFDPANKCMRMGPMGFRRKTMGCFAGETLIKMANGEERPISSIQAGEEVWNPRLKRSFMIKKVTVGPEDKGLLKIRFAGSKTLRVTADHPFFNASGGILAASDVENVVLAGGVEASIGKETESPMDNLTVYNIEIDAPHSDWEAHLIEANGVIVGDHVLQMQLKAPLPLSKSFDDAWDASYLAAMLVSKE